MKYNNLNKILDREKTKEDIINCINEIDSNLKILNYKSVLFVSGPIGCGKSTFVNDILIELNYDIINFETEQNRNSSNFDFIKSFNLPTNNVLKLMNGEKKKNCVLIDNLDSLNTNDKSGLSNLIKLIRPKKTIKQKKEDNCKTLIVCICNDIIDKKINEFKKISYNFQLEKPNTFQINKMLLELVSKEINKNILVKMEIFIENDIRKFFLTLKMLKDRGEEELGVLIECIIKRRVHRESKELTSFIIGNKLDFADHDDYINESDRTIVSLLFHENIIDVLSNINDKSEMINTYNTILNNFCIGDYYDKITFQKQIWLFNELTSIIKNISNNNILNEKKIFTNIEIGDIRFTKILTKYSTEYNNINFIINLSTKLGINSSDLKDLFSELKINISVDDYIYFEERFEIKKLDISRMFRYIENKTSKESIIDYE